MPKYNAVQYVELFHLVFLDLLGRKLDRKSYCLKGGCNLRFFLKSFRYSEDMDIDVAGIGKEKLEEAVDGIAASDTFSRILRVNGISLDKCSAPKQTETTQRWKFLIRGDGIGGVLNTKIEFSRRGFKGGTEFGNIDPLIICGYALQPIMASHYGKDSALQQKIEALATRKITQARDIFDLNLLLSSGADIGKLKGSAELFSPAAENAISVSFTVFKSQVLSYLHPDLQSQYDSEEIWNDMVLRTTDILEKGMQYAAR